MLAPKSVQEAADLTYEAFDLAEKWRMPVMILADGLIGQMMEGVVLPPSRDAPKRPATALGRRAPVEWRARPTIMSLRCSSIPPILEAKVRERFERYEEIAKARTSFEAVNEDKAELVFVAYGTASRVCLGAIQAAKSRGPRAGPLAPDQPLALSRRTSRRGSPAAGKSFLVVEMSMGQMVEDVRLASSRQGGLTRAAVDFFGRCGGIMPSEEEVLAEATECSRRRGRIGSYIRASRRV